MRLLIQRVNQASVIIEGLIHSSIENGLLVFIGIEEPDTVDDIDWLIGKLINLRIFDDESGVMNLSVKNIKGEILLVSQFTLHASTKKGNRPSYIRAARPEQAKALYNLMIEKLNKEIVSGIKSGIFGADMKVGLINDGPVTIWIDSKNRE